MSALGRSVFLTMLALPAAGQDFGRDWSPVPPLPPFSRPAEAAGTISLAELRNPLRGKALDIIRKAEKHLRSGDARHGFEVLRTALDNPQAAPYALGLMGTEHLKQGLTDTAIVELEQSVRLLPGNPKTRSNLALALFLKGKDQEGLAHARKSVQLDPGSPKSRYVLGQLLARLGQVEEALFHVRIAATELPGARQLLAKLEPASTLAGTPPSERVAEGLHSKE